MAAHYPWQHPSSRLAVHGACADPRNTYAATKVHGEHLADTWAREANASAAALRFHNIYGPGLPTDTRSAGMAALFRSRLMHDEPPLAYEVGRQQRNFVHVEDVDQAVIAATVADLPPGWTALNIGTAQTHKVGQMPT